MKDNTDCNELRQEVARCHLILDEAGVPELLGETDRLYHRVSRLASEHTLGASELTKVMQELKNRIDDLENTSDSTRQD